MIPLWAAAFALWLGVLTSISPCPLTTNIAAVAFLGRRVGSPRAALGSGLLYAAGQLAAYAALAAAIVGGLSAKSTAGAFLRAHVSRFLGPILILAGMAILGLLGSGLWLNLAGARLQERIGRGRRAWAAVLGALLAWSFCPGSAAIFFGGLIPLAEGQGSGLVLPLLYGLGAAGPVVAMAVLMAFASGRLGAAFDRLRLFERWARGITGTVFILVGTYRCLGDIFGLSLPGGG